MFFIILFAWCIFFGVFVIILFLVQINLVVASCLFCFDSWISLLLIQFISSLIDVFNTCYVFLLSYILLLLS